MINQHQLDLFRLISKAADVVPFPADRMAGELRDTMKEVLALPQSRRDEEINLRAGLVWFRFVSCGITPAEAKRQQTAYQAALKAAVERSQVVDFLYGRSGEQ